MVRRGREIIALDRLDGERAEPGNAEERFQQQHTGKQERDRHDNVGQNRDQRVAQHMAHHDPHVAAALGARRAHIVPAGLLDEDGPVKPHIRPETGQHADQHRQGQEPRDDRGSGSKPDIGKPPEQHADQILAADDIEQPATLMASMHSTSTARSI